MRPPLLPPPRLLQPRQPLLLPPPLRLLQLRCLRKHKGSHILAVDGKRSHLAETLAVVFYVRQKEKKREEESLKDYHKRLNRITISKKKEKEE